MSNKKYVRTSLVLMGVCTLVIGFWLIQAEGSQTSSVGTQLLLIAGTSGPDTGQGGAAGVKPGGGTTVKPGEGEGTMKTSPTGEKAKDVGGIYCTRTCMMMPDLWDQSCASVCTE